MVSPEDLRERLRPAVEDYADTVRKKAEEQEVEHREEWVCPTEEGGTELTEIAAPSRGVKHLIDPDDITHFEDCAEWLEDVEDEVHLTHTNTKSTYERWLRNFSSKTFNYVGDYDFDEEAYRAAFADKAEPHFEEALTLDILIPLPGLVDNSEPVTFTPQSPEYPDEQYLCTVISDFSIDEITVSEMAAMQNKSMEGLFGEPTKLGWEGRLRFTVEINDRSRDLHVPTDLVEQAGETSVEIVRKVVDGLRLSEPQEDNIWFGPIFILRDNWITYRTGSEGVERAYRHPDCDIEYRNLQRFSLDEIGARSFANQFWEEKADLLTSDTFERPIRRYNRTYLPGHTEDHILNCHIALESLLMKGSKGGTSFRMPIGAAILLKDRVSDPMDVYYFFDVLREARNKIVHEDKTIEDINAANLDELPDYLLQETDAGDRISKFQFVKHAREYLALLIKEYHRIEQEEGLNIHEANQELVEEDEIMEAVFND
ncbi:hypothetical protein [Natronoglomus mannanivorans]|uniref:HEPN domain-containing protein n=1 Tax=Natronoglomus mannanivorans TaxID=2979990 RepID=A0AAP2YVF9_9EURY|nr:HEPN domain-containing protein [Halobacteria archaeon AArc-xg1-1]